MNAATWDLLSWLTAWLAMATLQASLVAGALLALERFCRHPLLRSGLVSLAVIKFAVPPWLAWPVALPGATHALGVSQPAMGTTASGSVIAGLLLLSIWGAGCLAALWRWGVELRKVWRTVDEAAPCEHETARAALRDAVRELSLRRAPELRTSRRAAAPFVAGIAHPVIVLPEHWLATLSVRDLGTVLLHEVAHVRRRDLLRLGFVSALGVLWWWNPVFHWAARRWRLAIEEGCDSAVLARGTTDAAGYGAVLLRAARLMGARTGDAALSAAVAGMSARALESRLLRITSQREHSRFRMALAALALAAVALLAGPYAGRSMLPGGPAKHSALHGFQHGLAGGHSHQHAHSHP